MRFLNQVIHGSQVSQFASGNFDGSGTVTEAAGQAYEDTPTLLGTGAFAGACVVAKVGRSNLVIPGGYSSPASSS